MGLDVFAQRAGISVAFLTPRHFAEVGFLLQMCTCVFESIAGVGVSLVTTVHGTYIRSFTWKDNVSKSIMGLSNSVQWLYCIPVIDASFRQECQRLALDYG